MNRLLSFCFFVSLFLPATLYSQKVQLKGSVVDSVTREPLQYATIQVINPDNKTVFAAISSDTLAGFSFSDVPVGNGYRVLIEYLGYRSKEIPVSLKPRQKILDLGFIALTPDYKLISEVQVTGKRKVKDLIDRVVYVVDSAILKKSVGTADILGSFPEINVNPITFETTINGKKNTLILINGINTGRSVDIRSINPNDIERVEVITSPPSSVDVNYDGVINIILKKIPSKGVSGNVDATFMANGRYVDSYSGVVFGSEKLRLNVAYSNYLRNNPWKTTETRINSVTNSTLWHCRPLQQPL